MTPPAYPAACASCRHRRAFTVGNLAALGAVARGCAASAALVGYPLPAALAFTLGQRDHALGLRAAQNPPQPTRLGATLARAGECMAAATVERCSAYPAARHARSSAKAITRAPLLQRVGRDCGAASMPRR